MKILLVAHGYPPESGGATEVSVRALARALCAAGHGVSVVAGSVRASKTPGKVELDEQIELDAIGGASFVVRRLLRPDLHIEHWHKTLSPRVSAAFRRVLASERPDVVHVHHWLRLSRDLVLAAAREGVPAVVSLADWWTSCPIGSRVRTDTQLACDSLVAANPCLSCAGRVPPRTPWVPRDASHMLLAERQRDLNRELDLARVRSVPSAAHGNALEVFLERKPGSLDAQVIAPLDDEVRASPESERVLAATLAAYERAIAAGAPSVAAQEWFEARMRDAALDEWDKSLSARTALELGITQL